jgi:hypothetical protein
MLDALEKLLVLQDRDRKIQILRAELALVEPQRRLGQTKAATCQAALEASRLKLRHIESDRKRLELEVEARKQQIEKYALQQFQTKKNEEYRALAHEIQMAREAILKLEDEQLALMEQGEVEHAALGVATRAAEESHRAVEGQLADLAAREENLKAELERFEAERRALSGEADPLMLDRYERLRRTKGERVLVGIDHGVCGGCHVRLPAQVVISCQSSPDLVHCPNCGRILYYTRDMSLVPVE